MDRRISKHEDRSNEITQPGEQKEKRMKKSRASKACETLSKTKIHPMGISEKRRKPAGQKGHLKIKEPKSSQILWKNTNLHIQEAQWIPSKIISKLLKNKERILKQQEGSNTTQETFKSRGSEMTYLKCWKNKTINQEFDIQETTFPKWIRN